MSTTTYRESGVDYGQMDPQKREYMAAARETHHFAAEAKFPLVPWTIGESCQLFQVAPLSGYIGFVVEGLGTKNAAADEMFEMLKRAGEEWSMPEHVWANAAWCNVMTIVNEFPTLGVRPVTYHPLIAAGSSSWFQGEASRQFGIGTKEACIANKVAWTGGESQALKGSVMPERAIYVGGSFGFVSERNLMAPYRLEHGDSIVILHSSGPHANGYSLLRRLVAEEKVGWGTEVAPRLSYIEAIMAPTVAYSPVIQACLEADIDLHYGVHISGHGWAKLMRANNPFVYVVGELPPIPPIFDFVQKINPMSDLDRWTTMSNGGGFALFLREEEAGRTIKIARALNVGVTLAGHIERRGELKQVELRPIGLTIPAEALQVR